MTVTTFSPRSNDPASATRRRRDVRAFTVIELLVVIAIIGLISTVATVSVTNARMKAKTTLVNADLKQLGSAILTLETDTDNWPAGCSPTVSTGSDIPLNAAQAGLASAPATGSSGVGTNCRWSAIEVAKWKGPYATKFVDPWGNAYRFDPDYVQYRNCVGKPVGTATPTIYSYGANGSGGTRYGCDDIVYFLR